MIYMPHEDYFEGILQIRDGNEELYEWIRKKVKRDKKAMLGKEKKVRGGKDFYFSSQHYLRAFAKKLNSTFPGILKISATLHTRKKDKDLYRITAFFRPLQFKKGDVITLQGEKVEVMRIGARAQIKNLETGKRKDVSLDVLLRARR